MKPFVVPAGSARLFDLIKAKDQKFLNAFYFAVKDTLVAPDIKRGTEIAYDKASGKTHRLVTLMG